MNSLACLAFVGLLAFCVADNTASSDSSYGNNRYQYPEPAAYSRGGPAYHPRNTYPAPNAYPAPNSYPAPAVPSYPTGNQYQANSYYPAPAPAPAHYGYNPHANNARLADSLLERLNSVLDVLDLQEENQSNKLRRLIDGANDNLDWNLNYENTQALDFQYRQRTQNERLDALEQRVAEITALRERVNELQADANAINDQVENVVYPARKQINYDLNDLRDINLDQNSRIDEAQNRADNVNARIDALFEKAWDNTRGLLNLDTDVSRGLQSVNRQRTALVYNYNLRPRDQIQTLQTNFSTPVEGVPQFYAAFISGFDFVKNKYNYGIPTLYAATSYEVWNTRGDLQYSEMSTGGWNTRNLPVNAAVVFFDTTQLSSK